MTTAVIVDAVRTPVGRYGGALSAVRPDDLAALVLKRLLERNPQLDPGEVEDVIMGAANQSGEDNRNVARMALLLAGFPVSVPGQTVNRLCGSGLQAVITACREVLTGGGRAFMAGGVESMSRAPYVMAKPDRAFARSPQVFDTTLGWRFVNPRLAEMHDPISMGETAEVVANRCGISREDQDRFAAESHRRALAAQAAGRFDDELVPVEVPGKPPTTVSTDEGPRPDSTLERLARLQPAFTEGGSVTAGNSSSINDGASAVLVMDEELALARGMTPLARFRSSAVAGVDPSTMGIGPIPASRLAAERAGLRVDEIELVELNEAFASQSLAVIRELNLDPARVNVNGGAIALGHPLGSSGSRLLGTLVHEMRRRGARTGLATMCIGVGQGIAMVVEAV